MKFLKTMINILLSFILMLGIIISTLIIILNRYTDKNNMLAKLNEINLYNSVYEEVRDGFENYIYQSGLEINIIDKICSKEKVKNDILSIINAMYGEGDSKIDSSEIRENLDIAINEYVEKQGRKLSKEEEENIQRFEDLIEESYQDQIGLYQKGSDEIARKLPRILNLLEKLELVCVVFTTIILIILIWINAKKVSVAGGYLGISLLSAGAVLQCTYKIIYSQINIEALVIFTKSLSNAVILILTEILKLVQTIGMWYMVIGIFCIILMNVLSLIEKK